MLQIIPNSASNALVRGLTLDVFEDLEFRHCFTSPAYKDMRSPRLFTIIFALSLFHAPIALAFETDQYNLPPEPLADIGEDVREYTIENIRIAVSKVNAEIAKCVASRCGSDTSAKNRLAYLRSEEAIARAVFRELGSGIVPFTKSGSWMNSHKFRGQPARYKTSYSKSIFVYLPTDYYTISPTVNMYGSSFGTDKIAHFFQQGYTYYGIAERAVAKGVDRNGAEKKAVNWGKMTERTYYGTLVGGVFSNGDLHANYVGMRFYQGLTKPIQIGAVIRPATLTLKEGIWEVNDLGINDQFLLRPFISDHMNEALNPSLFIPGLRSSIRGIVRKQSCQQWRALYPTRTKDDFDKITNALTLWHGEDYGFKTSRKFVTIGNTCLHDVPSTMTTSQ